jgi:hypothetical protein
MRREYTAQDAAVFTEAEEQLSKNGFDKWTQQGSQRNADLLDEFFQKNSGVPITIQNVYRAIEARKSEFTWLSQAQAAWYETAKKNPELANQLATFLATQGHPEQLVNEGDALFENLVLLFNEINTHPQPMAHAIDRINHRPGKTLRYVPKPRRTEPVSPAAKADDGQGFLRPSEMVKNVDGSWRSKTAAEQRADMEAAARAKQPDLAAAQLAAVREAKDKAESLQGSTHAETDQLRKIFVTSGTEIDWQATYQSRLAMQKQFNKHREVARFIR